MENTAAVAGPGGLIERVIARARARPGATLAAVLVFHVVVWTVLPILVCQNLQLDLLEDLALGREWQLGYWKHPPLPWWLADLAYRATGQLDVVYLLGPLSAAACMYFVWRLAREVVEPTAALIAVLALEGMHFYNFSVVKFAHDQMQLPFWALTGWLFYRALAQSRARDWILAGVCLALAFWSKYAAFALAATLGLFLVFDPQARRAWRTAGPYLMALAFLVVLAPHLWWFVTTGFQPLHYVDERAVSAAHWYQYLTFPAQWIAGQLWFLLPTLVLAALALAGVPRAAAGAGTNLPRRYVLALALGPFAVTTMVALPLGRLPIAMWGYPLWNFLPLAAVMWLQPGAYDAVRLRRFAIGFLIVLIGFPVAYAADELIEPFLRDRRKATLFPGRELAEVVTRAWRARTGTPLHYVGGGQTAIDRGEFAANNIAVYSPDRPHVIVHGDMRISPWIDPADLRRRGAVLVWENAESAENADPPALPPSFRASFAQAQVQPLLRLQRKTSASVRPAVIGYAFVLPQQ